MKTKILLSVIIPCFNNGEYVYECLKSIPFTEDIEIIIVNDGSTDNSESEIERFISENKNINISLINQKNQGVSAARNAGLVSSKGRYISFLDADDLFHPEFWQLTYNALIYNKPDMVIYNASRFFSDDVSDNSFLEITNLENGYHKIEKVDELSELFNIGGWYVWSRIYKRELFNDIKFPINREYEDMAIIPIVTSRAKSIFSIKNPLVLYRHRQQSITTSEPKKHHIDDIIYAMESIYSIFINSDKTENTIKMLAKTMQREYQLLRSFNKKIFGYYYFDKNQISMILKVLKPFRRYFKLSLRVRIPLIRIESAINRQRYINN